MNTSLFKPLPVYHSENMKRMAEDDLRKIFEI